ncbi:uncharacterized protein RCC_09926 [Ramularia collo-cygni]|uniref:Uncharacterized protein n=1 Tax=Ramularia collo-cygni TaxID=112498 RepID=A0A2D3VL14_9PEZI|nr:uncharacterized protein RCC_09926 [Ramularia collo-cygni]CZT24209.1 uncharacterized protein RCC_09926 [Ramularia collo-cygni]
MIFDHLFQTEIAAGGFAQGDFPYSSMGKQYAEKGLAHKKTIHSDWLKIAMNPADDAERQLRAATKTKLDAAAALLEITLNG